MAELSQKFNDSTGAHLLVGGGAIAHRKGWESAALAHALVNIISTSIALLASR